MPLQSLLQLHHVSDPKRQKPINTSKQEKSFESMWVGSSPLSYICVMYNVNTRSQIKLRGCDGTSGVVIFKVFIFYIDKKNKNKNIIIFLKKENIFKNPD